MCKWVHATCYTFPVVSTRSVLVHVPVDTFFQMACFSTKTLTVSEAAVSKSKSLSFCKSAGEWHHQTLSSCCQCCRRGRDVSEDNKSPSTVFVRTILVCTSSPVLDGWGQKNPTKSPLVIGISLTTLSQEQLPLDSNKSTFISIHPTHSLVFKCVLK